MLHCSVTNCASNRDAMCCRNGINVGGVNAKTSDCTCCEAFQQEIVGVTNQSMCQNPNPDIRIHCDAMECVHNNAHKCTAKDVNICGNHAGDKHETKCTTFKAK